MDETQQIRLHKKLLLKEVAAFCRRDHTPKEDHSEFLNSEMASVERRESERQERSIHSTIAEIRERQWKAVFFGGMLRSLLVSKLDPGISRRPRDIDIVISGARIEQLEDVFEKSVTRRTRFGGLQLRRVEWQFDVWPLEETHALVEDSVESPSFEHLPYTTFFNVEAVAVDVWPPRRGVARRLYSGDDQFFRSIINRTIEINRESNPYPELCVVRGLVMAANLRWKVGPRLLAYLGRHGCDMSSGAFEAIQQKHYGRVQCPGVVFTDAMKAVATALANGLDEAVELPLPTQLTLWPEDDVYSQRIHLRALKATTKKPKP